MIYPHNFEQKTGFNKLRAALHSKCLGTLGESRVDQMQFTTDIALIRTQLSRAKEFMEICLLSKDFPQDNYYDTRQGLKRIAIGNTYLSQQELYDLKRSCETIKNINVPETIDPQQIPWPGDVQIFSQSEVRTFDE